jgi:hypothetical protein
VLWVIASVRAALLFLPAVFRGILLFVAVFAAAYQLTLSDQPAVAIEGGDVPEVPVADHL